MFQAGKTRGGLRATGGGRKDPASVSTIDDSEVLVMVSTFICSGVLLAVVEAMLVAHNEESVEISMFRIVD